MNEADPGEVMVSRTVRDLVAGSHLALEPARSRHRKGLAESWELFRVNQ